MPVRSPAQRRQRQPLAATGAQSTQSSITQPINITTYRTPDGVPDILIDGIAGVAIINGVAKFRCFAAGTIPDEPSIGQIVVRIGMGVHVMIAVHDLMGRIIADLRTSGVLPPPEGR
jgi:hypothetical protein